MKKIKVLIVDDSALMRQMIAEILKQDPEIEVVGTAADPYVAREKILALNPDVLTLDVEMPRMDGLSFLEKLMAGRPMPVVMLSSLTEKGCETTLRALELGAVDFVTKPKLDLVEGMDHLIDEIIGKVKQAASARVQNRVPRSAPKVQTGVKPAPSALITSTHKVIAIGGSTGGTEALMEVLTQLPPDSPGVVAGDSHAGRIYQVLRRTPRSSLSDSRQRSRGWRSHPAWPCAAGRREFPYAGHPQWRHVFGTRVPSPTGQPTSTKCQRTFQFLCPIFGTQCRGFVILTGMGNDGAEGLLAMKKAGAHTIAQDEASCVVFGMPREAIALNAAGKRTAAVAHPHSGFAIRAVSGRIGFLRSLCGKIVIPCEPGILQWSLAGMRSRNHGSNDRKAAQLCAQVRRALDFGLSEALSDSTLDAYIMDVLPAPNTSHLLVTVQPAAPLDEEGVRSLQATLERHAGMLRTAVAESIHRRKTPTLSFRVVPI